MSDGADSRTYTLTVVKIDVDALSDDATLSSLTVDGAAVEGFAADVHSYRVKVDHDVVSATVAATATEPAARVTIAPADADTDTDGHQVALKRGAECGDGRGGRHRRGHRGRLHPHHLPPGRPRPASRDCRRIQPELRHRGDLRGG